MIIHRLLAAALLLAAPAAAETGVTDKEILVGSCTPLTGPAKAIGEPLTLGTRLYFDHINEQGGVHGRKLKYVTDNDEYVDKAVECFDRLANQGVFAGVGFQSAASASKIVRMAEAKKIPVLGFSNGAQFMVDPVKRYVFAVRPTFTQESSLMTKALLDELKVDKIAVIYQNDVGGISQMDGIIETLKKAGKALVASAPYARDLSDMEAAYKTVKAAGPQAVFITGTYIGPTDVVKRAAADGWKPIFLTIGARDPIVKNGGPAAEGVIVSNVVPGPDRTDLPTVALYQKLLKKAGKEAEASYYGVEGMANAMVFVEGVKRAGKNLDRENFADALEGLQGFDLGLGATRKISYSKTDHAGLDEPYITVVRGGKLAAVEKWSALKK